uniref:Chromo domain-containing protein n=1 Tax=Cyprinus carpio TaxID=7962 RepID=A0A8C1P0L0_CYPCA
MTKPKQKPCPHCQALNNISCKTCKACFASLPLRKRVKNIQKHIEESAWMSNTKKHRNAARVVDSARIAVKKLEVLGYKPVLFISKEKKNGFVAEVITSMGPFAVGPLQTIFERMTSLYEFFIKNYQRIQSHTSTAETVCQHQTSSLPPTSSSFDTLPPPSSSSSSLPPTSSSFDTFPPPSSSSSSSLLPPSSTFYTLPPPPLSSSSFLHLLHSSSSSSLPPTSSSFDTLPPPPSSSSSSLPPPSTFYTLPPPPSSSSSSLTPPTSSYITLLSPTSSSCTLPSPPTSFPTPPPTPFSSTLTPTTHCTNPPPPFNFSNLSPTNPSFPCQNTHAAPINTDSSSTIIPRSGGKQRKWMYKQAECQVHPRLKQFPYDKIIRRRTSKEGVEEVKVRWKPCSGCGMKWTDTWEPYNLLSPE